MAGIGLGIVRHFELAEQLFEFGIRIDRQFPVLFLGAVECGQSAFVGSAVAGQETQANGEAVAFVGEVAEGERGAVLGREGRVGESDGGFELFSLEDFDVCFEGTGFGHGEKERELVGGLGLVSFDEAGEGLGVD